MNYTKPIIRYQLILSPNSPIDSNEVYWMGLRLAYEPQQLILPTDKKVVNVGASHKSVAVVTGNYLRTIPMFSILIKK